MKKETYYFLQGNAVACTAEFVDETEARIHFMQWCKASKDPLNHIFTLARPCISFTFAVEVMPKKMEQPPKLENLVNSLADKVMPFPVSETT